MRNMTTLATLATLAMAVPAFAQTGTWSNDKYTVDTGDLDLGATFVGDTIEFQYLPQAIANPASDMSDQESISFDFIPKPGYRISGEQVTYGVDMDVHTYDLPATLSLPALGIYAIDIDGQYHQGATSDGGTPHYGGSHVVDASDFVIGFDAEAREGITCPLGDEANGCNFGIDFVFLDSTVAFTTLDITPVVTPVPEPAMAASWLAGLGAVAVLRRRKDSGARRADGRRPGGHAA